MLYLNVLVQYLVEIMVCGTGQWSGHVLKFCSDNQSPIIISQNHVNHSNQCNHLLSPDQPQANTVQLNYVYCQSFQNYKINFFFRKQKQKLRKYKKEK